RHHLLHQRLDADVELRTSGVGVAHAVPRAGAQCARTSATARRDALWDSHLRRRMAISAALRARSRNAEARRTDRSRNRRERAPFAARLHAPGTRTPPTATRGLVAAARSPMR